jgi:PAS domain-containing protein
MSDSDIAGLEKIVAELRQKLEEVEARHDILAAKYESALADLNHYKIAFDQAPILIWFKDGKNNIIKVNKAAAALAGKTPEQLEGKSTWDVYPADADNY